jgi:nitrate reductase gamma subunit
MDSLSFKIHLGLCFTDRGRVEKMDMLHVIIWMIYPYTVVAILGMGLVWQYDMEKVVEGSQVELKTSQTLKRTITSLMGLCLITGIAVFIFSSIANEPRQLFHWVLSLFRLQPDMELIMNISILSQVHLLLVLTLLLVFSFTKYISYLFIPHQFIRVLFLKKNNK